MKDLPIDLLLYLYTFFTGKEIVQKVQIVCKEWYGLTNCEYIVNYVLETLKIPLDFRKKFKLLNLTTIGHVIEQWNIYGPTFIVEHMNVSLIGVKIKWKMFHFINKASIHHLNAKIVTNDNFYFEDLPLDDPFSKVVQIKGTITSNPYKKLDGNWVTIEVDEIKAIKDVEREIQYNVPFLTFTNEMHLIEHMGKLICWEGKIKSLVEEGKNLKIHLEGCDSPIVIKKAFLVLKEKDKIKVIGRIDSQGVFYSEDAKLIEPSSYYSYAENEIIIFLILLTISLIYSFVPPVRWIGSITIVLFGLFLQSFLMYLLYNAVGTFLCFFLEMGLMGLVYFFWDYFNFMSFFTGLGFIAWFIMISMIVLYNKFIKWIQQRIYLNKIKKNF